MPELTREDVINAIEKNGYTQGRSALFAIDPAGNFEACALGQALLNLGLANEKIIKRNLEKQAVNYGAKNNSSTYYTRLRKIVGATFINKVVKMNDEYGYTCGRIAKALRKNSEYE